MSSNGVYSLVMQTDGNLVLYQSGATVLWASPWAGVPTVANSKAILQTDGNFVLYRPDGVASYNTCTLNWSECVSHGQSRIGASLTVQNDGNVVIYNSSGVPVWDYRPDNMMPTPDVTECFDGGSSNPSGAFCRTDSLTFTWFTESSVESADRTAFSNALATQYNPTELTTTEQSPGVYSGTSETDVIIQENSSGIVSPTIARVWCDDEVTSGSDVCDQHYLRYWYGSDQVPGTVMPCHELGHSVGLTHADDAAPRLWKNDANLGCMAGHTDLRELVTSES